MVQGLCPKPVLVLQDQSLLKCRGDYKITEWAHALGLYSHYKASFSYNAGSPLELLTGPMPQARPLRPPVSPKMPVLLPNY